jgi:hypothetical protein
MDLDGIFTGSPTIVVGGNLLAGAQNKNQIFTNLDLQVVGNMIVQNANFRWSSGTVTVGGNFTLLGSGDVDVPNSGSLEVDGSIAVNSLLSIDGPTGSGSGGIVSWGGNISMSGNNKGLNNCPTPYASPFDLSTCTQGAGSDDTAPVVTSGTTGSSLVENSGAGQTVYTITATDAEGVDSYAIGGTDVYLLGVNSSSGVVSLTANPDYETKASYSFTVTASDAAGNTSAATTVTFAISDVDEVAPSITSGTSGNSLAENSGAGQTVYTITATDAVGVDSYAIGGTDAALLGVNSSTGAVSLTANPDYETKASYSFTATASDAAGNTSAATTVTFSISDVDEVAPEITLLGANPATVTQGNAYGDAGATATDGTDGNITGNIVTNSNVNVNTIGSYSVTYDVSDAAGNAASQVVRTVNVEAPATRTSVASGSFNDASTWDCNCVPSTGENVVIAHDLTLANPFTVNAVNSFTINNGTTLTFSSYLSIAGDFINNGTLDGGDLRFNGTSAQTPTIGNIVESIEVNNSSGVTLSSNLDVTSGLVLTKGELNLGGNALKLKSSSGSTAYISESCSGTGTISGAVTVEQFVPESGFGHHYLSTPMSSLTLSELSDDFEFKLNDEYFPHLYYYDESNSEWVTPSAVSDAMVVGRGYTGYFSGEIVVDITGVPNSGDVTIPLTSSGDGWNLIGNPFASPIDWDNVTIPSGVSGAVYAWDHIPAIWGRYATYLDGVGTNGGSNVVPMMQGFFMSSTVNTDLVFYCGDRIATNDPGVFYRKSTAKDPLIRLQAGGFGYTTEAVVRFKTDATDFYEQQTDALMFPSGAAEGMDFASLSVDERNLVINTFSKDDVNKRVPLYLKIGTAGTYKIDMTAFDYFSSTDEVYLHDEKLGVSHPLSSGAYEFDSEVVDGADRFFIEVSGLVLGLDKEHASNSYTAVVIDGRLNVRFGSAITSNTSLSVVDVMGRAVHTQVLNSGNQVFILPGEILEKGAVYFVKVQGYSQVNKVIMH